MGGLGGCIGLIVVGAILTFATDWEMSSVDLDLVGLIMMAVGAIGLAVYTSVLKRRRTTMGAVPVVEEHRRDGL
ncbi:DUF6458 family protein [Streptomyces xanthophaeus]|uniref:DUF6458 family protein n=1 Tax=Streptomyces xanthophaeus TaxID=67385 RepID=UPI00342CF7B4|nr:DUF6458 family protein [Streptomyces xanthophaeus]WST60265.1 DUF6458 family protein [Streptomyces xanthophaeus]